MKTFYELYDCEWTQSKKKDKNNANISVYILIIYNTAHKLMTGDL